MASFCQMILIESASDSSGFVVYMLDFFCQYVWGKKTDFASEFINQLSLL